jgi:hypothetical protein
MGTAALLDGLAGLTADQLQQELDRLSVSQRLVKGLLSARRRIEAEDRELADLKRDRKAEALSGGAAG